MDDCIVWKNINGEEFTIDNIDDEYLINILKFASRGNGYPEYVSKYPLLYKEAVDRELDVSLIPECPTIVELNEATIEYLLNRGYEELP